MDRSEARARECARLRDSDNLAGGGVAAGIRRIYLRSSSVIREVRAYGRDVPFHVGLRR